MVLEDICDKRRLTHQTLYISGSIGTEHCQGQENVSQTDSWISRLYSIFCGTAVSSKWCVSRNKMQVKVKPSPPVTNETVPKIWKVGENLASSS